MIFEISGGGFGNKGAQLMLLAVLDRLAKADTGIRCFMSPALNVRREETRKLGLITHFPLPPARGGRLFPLRFRANLAVSSLVPGALCEALGVVRYQDSDGLLDISGVRFGDAVPPIAAQNFLQLARSYRRRNKPVVLLPQMLGPFRTKVSGGLFRDLHASSTLIVARDSQSYAYAQEVIGPSHKLLLAPDLTVFSGSEVAPAPFEVPYGCIVPNARMLDRGDVAWRQIYAERLIHAANTMLAAGLKPVVLVHSVEGNEDHPLAEFVQRAVGTERCEIRIADDPLETKAFIAGARLLVASRYHSVVSALSSGVPAIVMGWAHKYESLLADFGVPTQRHEPNDGVAHLAEHITTVAAPEENARLRAQLLNAKAGMRVAHEAMWAAVGAALGLPIGRMAEETAA